jgi:hypothetical protein
MTINILGLFIPLRNQKIYTETRSMFNNEISLTENEFYRELNKIDNLPVKEYVEKITMIVDKGMAHYWDDTLAIITDYNLRIPIWQNFILFGKSFVNDKYKMYEFCDQKKAIERGVGNCSQQTWVLINILNKRGIVTKMVDLNGHVVATTLVDKNKNEWWILDPDYGLVIKKDLKTLEKEPDFLKQVYNEGLKHLKTGKMEIKNDQVKGFVDIYTSSGDNVVLENNKNGFLEIYCKKERESYILIWVIPLVLMAPAGLIYIFRYVHKKKQ